MEKLHSEWKEDGGSFLPARRDEETGSNAYKDVYAFDNRGAF